MSILFSESQGETLKIPVPQMCLYPRKKTSACLLNLVNDMEVWLGPWTDCEDSQPHHLPAMHPWSTE